MKRFSSITIFIILAICFGYAVQNRWKGDDGNAWRDTIRSDGYGYYSYLPCIFIYHEFDYKRVLKEAQKVRSSAYNANAIVFHDKEVDKCFPGVALLLAPFFLIAYLLSYLLGYGTGGYEFLFQASVSIGALFYLAVGLIFLRKLLKGFGISEFIVSLTLILVVFGTNLLYYATVEPSMGHIYSFGLTAVFLFFVKKSIGDFSLKNLIGMAVVITILAIIRPTNLLNIFFIPFLAGSLNDTLGFIQKFFKSKKTFILLLIVAGILGIEPMLWYWQTGHFFVWSYPNEGFNFKNPHFLDILFSYRKGWFVYTPLMLIALLGGLVSLYRQNIFRFFNALFFFLLLTFILSSWSTWYYGGAFGLRAYVDFYSAFAILLALFLNSLTSLWLKVPVMLLAFLCVCFNLVQTYQYNNAIIPYDEVNKEKYWRVFLKTDHAYGYFFDYPDTSAFNYLSKYVFTKNFEHDKGGSNLNITTAFAHSGRYSAFADKNSSFTPALTLKASLIPKNRPLYAYVKFWEYMPNFNNNAVLVVCLKSASDKEQFWQSCNIQRYVFNCNEWKEACGLVELPAFNDPSDELQVYVYNEKDIIYIDDMEVTFGVPK